MNDFIVAACWVVGYFVVGCGVACFSARRNILDLGEAPLFILGSFSLIWIAVVPAFGLMYVLGWLVQKCVKFHR